MAAPLSPMEAEAGGIIVQRGTIAACFDPSPSIRARTGFVLLDAKAATIEGAPLPDIHPGDVAAKS